ncbi:MAG: zinc-binding dehydrogenase [Rhodocyclaceae bacterium]|jgi:putative phosphonate catabolism associated alcohol dehydrogenase|nr:zinc-binding dehydrogenase [Rhodocyclaceae bacterium]
MAALPAIGRLAVYDAPNAPFRIESYPLRPPAPGEALVKIRMATICRSDIHSWQGQRPNPCPGVLGHEIIGDIVALGEGVTQDMRGDPLALGDRVTWSEYFIPPEGDYFGAVLDLPQKAAGVDKYGHRAVAEPPHHHGGFGDYCYILPRSWILRLPDELTDEEATPLNCGVATMIAVTEAANIRIGHTVVVQGLGLLGLYGAAIAKARGARRVIGLDPDPARREMAYRFGVDLAFDAAADPAEIRAQCPPAGADAVIEVCGTPAVIPAGLEMLRIGGTYVLGGVVNPRAMAIIDANLILKKLLCLRGVHNYHPRHLVEALEFVAAHRTRFPFHALVDGKYPLDAANEAMADAAARRVLRAAIVP